MSEEFLIEVKRGGAKPDRKLFGKSFLWKRNTVGPGWTANYSFSPQTWYNISNQDGLYSFSIFYPILKKSEMLSNIITLFLSDVVFMSSLYTVR